MNVEGWRRVPLGAVCEISTKLGFDPELAPDTVVSFIPISAIDESQGVIVGAETRRYDEVRRGFTSFRDNDVLFAKITPFVENGKAAIARNLSNGLGFGSMEFYVLRAGAEVRAEWLFAFIRRPVFRAEAKANFTGSASQQRVPIEFLRRVEIPLPPLPEQDRIIDILSEVERLRRLRSDGAKLMTRLNLSLFDQMFGSGSDPESRLISELGEVRYGITVNSKRRQSGETVPYLRVANVGRWSLDLSDIASIQATERNIEKSHLRKGDVLVVGEHADPAAVGRAAVWNDELPQCLHQNHLLRIRPYGSEATPNFIAGCINSDKGCDYMRRCAKTSNALFTINSSVVNSMQVPCFSLPLQKEFERRYEAYLELIVECAQSSQRICALLNALLDRAFTGALTAAWRGKRPAQIAAALESPPSPETTPQPKPEPEAPPISAPQVITDREHLYWSFSALQRALFNRVATESDYFRAESIAKDGAFNLVGVQRGLQLLAAAGFIVPVSCAVSSIYVDSYRMPRPEDDARLELVLV